MKRIRLLSICLLFSAFSLGLFRVQNVFAEGESAFLPTWKLMSFQEKQHFIAGYLQGWLDAAKVTDIAIGFIKENPAKAIESLEGIKKVYDVSFVKPGNLVDEIDAYYAVSENKNATLSAAVTSAKASLMHKSTVKE